MELNTHPTQELENLKEDPGEGGIIAGLAAALCKHDEASASQ